MDQGTVTIIAVGLPAAITGLGIWLNGRIQIKLKEIDTAAKDREMERIEKDKETAEHSRTETMLTVETIVRKYVPNCLEIHTILESKLMAIANNKIQEAEQSRDQIVYSISNIVERIEGLKKDITDMIKDKTSENGIRDKFVRVSNNAIQFFGDPKVKLFATYKANAFFDFMMEYRNRIYKDDAEYVNAMNVITTLYDTVKNEGYNLAGKEFTDLFYLKFHEKSTRHYFGKLLFIKTDTVNDKSIRFVDESMSYLQQFLSEMVQAYGVWKEDQIVDLKNSQEELQKEKI